MTAADGVEGSPAADPPLSPTGRHAQAIGELMGDWGGVFALVRADLARLRLDEYQ